jgi:nitrogen fixation NifU-like protein
MEHNKSAHNRRSLNNPHQTQKGHNPSCGDDITLEFIYDGDVIKDIAFNGSGCAISQASTSMMIDLIKGKTKKEAIGLAKLFLDMIKKEENNEELLQESLEDAYVLKNISNMPARVKCATLSWHSLKIAIEK